MKNLFLFTATAFLFYAPLAHARGHYEDTDCDAATAKGSFHLYIDNTYAEEASRLSLFDGSGKKIFSARNDFGKEDQFVVSGEKANIETKECGDDRYTYTTETYTQEARIQLISPDASQGLGLKVGDVLNLTCVHETTQR
ncbi:MAG: hypothetical protein ACXVBE_04455 [Bdellovibrionota bacterium]